MSRRKQRHAEMLERLPAILESIENGTRRRKRGEVTFRRAFRCGECNAYLGDHLYSGPDPSPLAWIGAELAPGIVYDQTAEQPTWVMRHRVDGRRPHKAARVRARKAGTVVCGCRTTREIP